jgi:hypothetical protein
MSAALELVCVVMLGMHPIVAPWVATVGQDAPAWLLAEGWRLPLRGQDWRNQVTAVWGEATVFEAPLEDFGTVGVLAHSYLEGRRFTLLNEGDLIGLGWVDGREAWYRVTEIQVWTATEPGNEFSPLEWRGEVMDSWAVYRAVYGMPGRLVLQTCVGVRGGFYFVIAERATEVATTQARLEGVPARLPAGGSGPVVGVRDLGWIVSISGEVVYE